MPAEEENIENTKAEVKTEDSDKKPDVNSKDKNDKKQAEEEQVVEKKESNSEEKQPKSQENKNEKDSDVDKTAENKSVLDTDNQKSKSEDDGDNDEGDASSIESAKETSKKESDESNDKKGVPLLDQPLEVSGTRERKKVNRFDEEYNESKDTGKLEIPDGKGTPLGEIPRIDASISRFKNEDVKILHKLLYKYPGKTTQTKSNIKKFCGFDFTQDSEEYKRKIQSTQKFDLKQLKSICEMLDLEKKGTKDEIITRIVNFLLEPQDHGKVAGGGRPKRSAAVKASNRGYSSHDSGSADEKQTSRTKRGKGRRKNLKEDSSSGSDKEFQPSDEEEEEVKVGSRSSKRNKSRKTSSEEEASDITETSSEDSDAEPKRRKKSKQSVNSGSNKRTPLKRGRPPKKVQNKQKDEGESDDAKDNDDESSSEDEPLIKKKTKSTQPPTDEEIKTYVKEILDGANLEEITMKTVCKQVYANYPNFDLSHKKDFIKSTVKSLIST